MRNYRRTSCPSRILNFTVFIYSAYYPGCERCHQAPAASVGAAACKFIRIRHHHGGEEAAEGAARRESEATAPRHRGVRPVDGVAVQAAHHLGAPRRRLPSHVSKCNRRPRSLLLVRLVSFRLRYDTHTVCWRDASSVYWCEKAVCCGAEVR
jgi:hypothetical protein